jgi:hypothetical protein
MSHRGTAPDTQLLLPCAPGGSVGWGTGPTDAAGRRDPEGTCRGEAQPLCGAGPGPSAWGQSGPRRDARRGVAGPLTPPQAGDTDGAAGRDVLPEPRTTGGTPQARRRGAEPWSAYGPGPVSPAGPVTGSTTRGGPHLVGRERWLAPRPRGAPGGGPRPAVPCSGIPRGRGPRSGQVLGPGASRQVAEPRQGTGSGPTGPEADRPLSQSGRVDGCWLCSDRRGATLRWPRVTRAGTAPLGEAREGAGTPRPPGRPLGG